MLLAFCTRFKNLFCILLEGTYHSHIVSQSSSPLTKHTEFSKTSSPICEFSNIHLHFFSKFTEVSLCKFYSINQTVGIKTKCGLQSLGPCLLTKAKRGMQGESGNKRNHRDTRASMTSSYPSTVPESAWWVNNSAHLETNKFFVGIMARDNFNEGFEER